MARASQSGALEGGRGVSAPTGAPGSPAASVLKKQAFQTCWPSLASDSGLRGFAHYTGPGLQECLQLPP